MATARKTKRMPPANTKTLNAKRLDSENRKLRQKNEKLEQRNSELELISHSFLASIPASNWTGCSPPF